jgi:hypothetical protein
MTILVGRRGADPGELRDEIARIKALGTDFQDILDGRMPSEERLALSPLIDWFYVSVIPRWCLVGNVYGHPFLVTRTRDIVTSDLEAYAPELGWARTRSRFYRLGRPKGASSQS